MKQWVFNASPLILLGKIDRLGLIPDINPHFAIPQQVVQEINSGPDGDRAIQWLTRKDIQTQVLDVFPIQEEIRLWDLGKGESAVLQACLHPSEPRVAVLDDLAARKCAQVYQISVLGTIGILIKAKKTKLLGSIRPEIEKLVEVGSNLSAKLIESALQLANE